MTLVLPHYDPGLTDGRAVAVRAAAVDRWTCVVRSSAATVRSPTVGAAAAASTAVLFSPGGVRAPYIPRAYERPGNEEGVRTGNE